MPSHTIDPAHTALLLLDLEPAILAGLESDTAALLDRAARAVADARAARLQVAYVHVAFAPQDAASVPTHNRTFWAAAQNGMLPALGSPAADVHPQLRPVDGDIVVTKTRFGSFTTTALDTHLRGRGIDTLIVGGVSTSGAVLSTVRDAADRDYRLLVAEDLCADAVPELQRALFEHVFPVQAEIVDSAHLGLERRSA